MRHSPLLKEYLPIIESSQQRFARVCRNKTLTVKVPQYNWFSLTKSDMKNHYLVTVRNKFDTLQETSERHTPNDEYENFATTHIEAAAEWIQTKPSAKCRVLWETIAIREKWDNTKKLSLLNKRNPTNANVQKLKKELIHTKKNN